MTHRGRPHQPQHLTCSLQTEPHADLSPQKNMPPHSTYTLNSTVNLCLCLYGSSYFPRFFPTFLTYVSTSQLEGRVCVYCSVNVQSSKFKSPTSPVFTGDTSTVFLTMAGQHADNVSNIKLWVYMFSSYQHEPGMPWDCPGQPRLCACNPFFPLSPWQLLCLLQSWHSLRGLPVHILDCSHLDCHQTGQRWAVLLEGTFPRR